jgi:hypothetical protein
LRPKSRQQRTSGRADQAVCAPSAAIIIPRFNLGVKVGRHKVDVEKSLVEIRLPGDITGNVIYEVAYGFVVDT